MRSIVGGDVAWLLQSIAGPFGRNIRFQMTGQSIALMQIAGCMMCVEAVLGILVLFGRQTQGGRLVGQLHIGGKLPCVLVAILQVVQVVVCFEAGGLDGLLQLTGMPTVALCLQGEPVGQVVRRGIVFVGQVGMQGIGDQAIVGGLFQQHGVARLVEGLDVATLLLDAVVRVVSLQAQGAFVATAIHAVGIGRIGLVEQQAPCVERSADGRLREQAGQGDVALAACGQLSLFVAQVMTGVVGLQAEDALPSSS